VSRVGHEAVAQPCCSPLVETPLDEAEAGDLAHVFAALADPVRLRLLSLIANAGEVCACDLLESLDRSQPTVSHHTKVLADVGLIVGEKRGRWVWWSIVPDRLETVGRVLDPR
jgi:ArsR family transcriptional regulator